MVKVQFAPSRREICMQYEERVIGNVAILAVRGDITLKNRGNATLHDRVRGLLQRGHTRVLLDLAGVSYVDSAGLGELVQAHSTSRNYGGSLGVFNLTQRLRDMLVMTRLTTLIASYDSEAHALASLAEQA
jgi:anti-sigma B factor antagonist